MTAPGGMPAMPGVQFGNTPLDISSAVNSFAKGLQEARALRRKEQMDQAMLGIQFMNAQSRMGEVSNMNTQRFLDDLRAKGAFVNPGQSLVDTDWGALVQQSQQGSEAIRDWDLMSPAQRAGEIALYQQTGGQRGRLEPSREIRVPNLSGQGETVASLYMDPQDMRTWQAQRQDERGRWANRIREAYLNLAQQKFAFMRADPSEAERAVAGGARNMVEANRDLRMIEMNWPQSANWAGALTVLKNSPLARPLPDNWTQLVQSPIEQKYTIAMHRWLSEFFPAKAGKVLTENEIRTYFPMLFATGFTDPETLDEIYRARNGALGQVLLQAGPGTLLAIRSGQINPADVPGEILQQLQALYGSGPGANAPGNAPTQGPPPPRINSIRARQDSLRANKGRP